MTGSLKMAKLDFFTMKTQFFGYLSLAALVLIFGYTDSSITLLGINVAWYTALMSSNIFAIQEKDNLDRLYGSLSISLKNIIFGRYIFMVLNYILSFLGAIILYSVLTLFQNRPLDLVNTLFAFGTSFVIFSAITGVEMPLFFKMGYTKAKVWFLLVFVVILALALSPFFIPALSEAIQPMLANKSICVVIAVLASCVIQYISYRASILAYRKRV